MKSSIIIFKVKYYLCSRVMGQLLGAYVIPWLAMYKDVHLLAAEPVLFSAEWPACPARRKKKEGQRLAMCIAPHMDVICPQ